MKFIINSWYERYIQSGRLIHPIKMSKTMIKILFTGLLLVASATVLNAQVQDKNQLEKERQEIQQEIKEIEGQYKQVRGQKRQTLGQLNLLQRKINLQNRYISNINKQIRYINDDIYLSNLEIFRLQKQLDTLKIQYAKSVIYAYKNRSTYDFLNFIFSANSFSDAMKRVAYLKSYRTYRQEQVKNIVETQRTIQQRMQDQIARRQKKDEALQNQTVQVKELQTQKGEKDVVINNLKAREKDLQKELSNKKKKDASLKNAIAAIVRREIEEARKKAEAEAKANAAREAAAKPGTTTTSTASTPKKSSTRPDSYLDLNAKDVALNDNFEKNKGKLPWPVDNGFVSIGFGRKEYPISGSGRPVIIDNPGITISTPSVGTTVKAVFDGEVARIFNMGDVQGVAVRHGKYFTVYSNLSSVSVSNGQQIRTGQALGKAAVADDGSGGQIDFVLMIEKNNVNPESWLRR